MSTGRQSYRTTGPGPSVALLVGIVVAIALAATGCVGAHDRDELEAMIIERGGGVSNAQVAAIVDRLELEAGTDPAISVARFNFGGVSTATFEVRSRARPSEVDSFVFRGTDLVDVRPERVDESDFEEGNFRPLSTFALDRVEEMADRTLAEFDSTGGHATGLSLLARQQMMRLDVESPRARATAIFSAGGDLQEFDR